MLTNSHSFAEPSPEATDTLLTWERTVLTEQLLAILSDDWFNICTLDKLEPAIHFFSLSTHPHKPLNAPKTAAYVSLSTLHCDRFDKMSPAIKSGIPQAIFTHLGLNETNGPTILGNEGWDRVKKAYKEFETNAVSDTKSVIGSGSVNTKSARPQSNFPFRIGILNIVFILQGVFAGILFTCFSYETGLINVTPNPITDHINSYRKSPPFSLPTSTTDYYKPKTPVPRLNLDPLDEHNTQEKAIPPNP